MEREGSLDGGNSLSEGLEAGNSEVRSGHCTFSTDEGQNLCRGRRACGREVAIKGVGSKGFCMPY